MAAEPPPDDLDADLRETALRTALSIRAAGARGEAEHAQARRDLEERLQQLGRAQALLNATLESAPDAIVVAGLDGRILLHNQRYAALWGRADASLVGEPLAALDPAIAACLCEPQRYLEHVRDKAAADVPQLFEHRDGRWLERIACTPWLDGRSAGRAEHWRDVTEPRRAAAAAQAAEVARLASRAKSAFMSRMSHELRTPLNAILGFAQLLEVDPPSAPPELTKRRIGHIIGAGRHLLALVDDLLHIARIESGALELKPEALNVADMLDDCIAMTQSLAETHQVQLGVVLHADVTLAVRADRTRLRQVLVNLVSNACKYNRPGGRAVLSVDATRNVVEISVRDTGAGMTREQIDTLFEPFGRAPADPANPPSTGLGLVITRQLVLAMKGTIELVSSPGAGTTATVALPRA